MPFESTSDTGMLAVDTKVLVRLVARDDADQVSAAEDFVSKGAWVSHLVLAETIWVLDSVYELSRVQIATAVEMLLNHRDLTVQDTEVVTSALVHYRKRSAIAFSDCLVLEIARKAGHLPVGTFDRNFAKLDDVVLLR
jgi:predicted nucleic-acid-binding protein